MKDGLFFAAVLLGFVAVVVALLVLVAAPLDRASCNASTEGMTIPHTWGFFAGCRVKDPRAGWVPLKNYRVF